MEYCWPEKNVIQPCQDKPSSANIWWKILGSYHQMLVQLLPGVCLGDCLALAPSGLYFTHAWSVDAASKVILLRFL